jgi:thiol-disulfide isomerase/thioredoxin
VIPKIIIGILAVVSLSSAIGAGSPAEDKASAEIKAPTTTVVHLWAPWCSNCLAELKSGEWVKTIQAHPQVKFIFVSVWNNGEDGAAILRKYEIQGQPNVLVLADPGPRTGAKIKQFAGLPVSWIPTTWIFKGGTLRYALNYGELRFSILDQLMQDVDSAWEH